MGKDCFQTKDAQQIADGLDAVARSRSSRGQVFHDWLTMIGCTLTCGQQEQPYLDVVQRYAGTDGGQDGKRAVDRLVDLFTAVVKITHADPYGDVLGDVFQGGITWGEHGQFFTPAPLCKVMAELTLGDVPRPPDGRPIRVMDPACGSGRMLLAVAERDPTAVLFGQDIDGRCVLMTAINLALARRTGAVIKGSSLTLVCDWGYKVVPCPDLWFSLLIPMTGAECQSLLVVSPETPPAGERPAEQPAQGTLF